MVLNNLLDLGLHIGGDITSGDFGEEGGLCGVQVLTELGLPLGDLVDGDGIKLEWNLH